MRGMQLIRPGSLAKSSNIITSAAKNASCSRGWLRLVVQTIFATITVASFILILIMAIPFHPPLTPSNRPPRCQENDDCRITCRETPLFGEYEDDIIRAVSKAEEKCKSIILTLDSPMFLNNTMPEKWLSKLRTNIHELTIINGNLQHVPANAFLSQYTSTIRVLVFQNLVFRSWSSNSLVGLISLRRLYVNDCIILNVPRDALRAVDGTIHSLTITRSDHWDPTNVTGVTTFQRLKSVDFSYNSFHNVLGRTSFTGLTKCKVLFLNSCGITAIGAGAFDNLHSLQMLYLQDNNLVMIPPGLFDNIIMLTSPTARINLHNNKWHCDCSMRDIRRLANTNVLVTEPVCTSPEFFKDRTFSELDENCSQGGNNYENNTAAVIGTVDSARSYWDDLDDINGFVYVSNTCLNGMRYNSTNVTLRMFSPVVGHSCPFNGFQNIKDIVSFASSPINQILPKDSWIHLTYFLTTDCYSMVEITAIDSEEYGLVWYQTTCPYEVYCVSDVPSVFRIYNVDPNAQYVFCPIHLTTGVVERKNCVIYSNATFDYEEAYNKLHIVLYIVTGAVSVIFGALCVYAVILKHPHLLKGSKRILFVKHKTVDALVLPPKVPLRSDLMGQSTPVFEEKKIFIMPSNSIPPPRFNRNVSYRSSSTPSYISALQPTEDQLAEWRIRHHFDNNDLSFSTSPSELSTLSWVSSSDGTYHSIELDNYRIYESLK
ncbi:uncharacterized protein LOC110372611 [Helicoverpa armigera]|uniref:uncharacterized protein LOC110372611 n=1 Tax=Helicoverpa armigera TaxID=29058 RepID=UPI00308305EE